MGLPGLPGGGTEGAESTPGAPLRLLEEVGLSPLLEAPERFHPELPAVLLPGGL